MLYVRRFSRRTDKQAIRAYGFEWDVYSKPLRVVYPRWRAKYVLFKSQRVPGGWSKHVFRYYRPVTCLPRRVEKGH